MKQKISTLLFVVCIGITAMAQQPVYPTPGEVKARYNKKIAPQFPYSKDLLKKTVDQTSNHFPYARFDSSSKQIKVVTADSRFGSTVFDASSLKSGALAAKPPAGAATCFHLTKDINTASGFSDPLNFPPNHTYAYAVLNNVSYFAANDGIHGTELWQSDGTALGTYLVKDIYPGPGSSGAYGIIAANGLLYFTAFTEESGAEIWVSDGTEIGTHLLKDITPGINFGPTSQIANANGTVFFVAPGFPATQIWKTNGTEAGTSLVKDIYDIAYDIYELTAVNADVFFVGSTPNSGYQLFKSDGTDIGTYMVKQIGSFQYDFFAPMQLTVYDNKLYFSVDDGTGRKLWSSDGTEAGTNYAAGFNDVFIDQNFLQVFHNRPFPILNNIMYLSGNTPSDGGGLYKYDASNTDGIVLVKDFAADPGNSFGVPPDQLVIGDKLYFKVINVDTPVADELWVTDGETANTVQVKVFPPGEYIYNFASLNGDLFFVKFDPTYGNELWKTDGTDVGTVLVRDIMPGTEPSYPENLTFCNGKLLFRAIDKLTGGELWSTDGSELGTNLVLDINSATTNGSDAGTLYKGMASSTNGVVFGAFTPDKGYELYKSDGTANGTVLLNEITPGTDWSYPNSIIYKNGFNYFIGDNAVGTTIYRTDGTPAGLTKLVYDIDRSLYYVTNFNITDNGMPFYILGRKDFFAFELWRSDGTQAGTIQLASNLSFGSYIVTSDNIVYFVASDGFNDVELWKSDGTIAGTKMVKDIYPGANGSYPYSLFVYKKDVYFGAYDGVGINYQLWKTDGSQKGTIKLKNITPAGYEYVYNPDVQVFCVSNNTLFFSATDFQAYGSELWKTNGTAGGTVLVKDINLQGYSNPYYLTDVNGVLYFSADDGVHGAELWSSKGLSGNTKLVKDIDPFSGSYPGNFCGVGNRLYFFSGPDYRLWSSDGTADNTQAVTDQGLDGLYNFGRLVNGAGKLFFGATSLAYGSELYVGDDCATATTAGRPVVSQLTISESNQLFDALLYPNPSNGPASLKLTRPATNGIVTITDVTGKVYWQGRLGSGTQISLPAEKLAAGIYLVTVKTSLGNRNFKFVKQ